MSSLRVPAVLVGLSVYAFVGCVATDGTIEEPSAPPEETESVGQGLTTSLRLPFPDGHRWHVGFDYVSHFERGATTYDFDWGWEDSFNSTVPNTITDNKPIVAPHGGTIAAMGAVASGVNRSCPGANRDYICVNFTGGGSAKLGHVIPISGINAGTAVAKGQQVGTVMTAATGKNGCSINNEIAHLHYTLYSGSNCDANKATSVPASGAYRMDCAPDYRADGTRWTTSSAISSSTCTSSGGSTSTSTSTSFRRAVTLRGKCMDMAGTNTGAGNLASAQIYDCKSSGAQWFNITTARELKNAHGRCLDVEGPSTADGADLINYDCHGGNNQKWTFSGMDLLNFNSGKCIDVPGQNFVDGQDVQLYTCNDTSAQKWTYLPSTRELKIGGKCLDVTSSSTVNGTRVQLWTCNGSAAQKWTPGRGGFTSALDAGKCLDVASSSTTNGATIQLWTCNDTNAQKFALRGPIRSVYSGKCVDLTGGILTNGNQLQQYTCVAGHQNQEWTIWMP